MRIPVAPGKNVLKKSGWNMQTSFRPRARN